VRARRRGPEVLVRGTMPYAAARSLFRAALLWSRRLVEVEIREGEED